MQGVKTKSNNNKITSITPTLFELVIACHLDVNEDLNGFRVEKLFVFNRLAIFISYFFVQGSCV